MEMKSLLRRCIEFYSRTAYDYIEIQLKNAMHVGGNLLPHFYSNLMLQNNLPQLLSMISVTTEPLIFSQTVALYGPLAIKFFSILSDFYRYFLLFWTAEKSKFRFIVNEHFGKIVMLSIF